MNVLPYLGSEFSPAATALYRSDGSSITYAEVAAEAHDWAAKVSDSNSNSNKRLIFFYVPRAPCAVGCLLGILHSGHAVALLDPDLSEAAREKLEALYQPWLCLDLDTSDNGESIRSKETTHSQQFPIHPDVSLLLSTSGSTGSPKFARLSRSAVLANAQDIVSALGVSKSDRGSAHLDFHYSYGFSIFTTHLMAGASLAFTSGKFTDRAFWDELRSLQVTHLPGVPFHYEMMTRLGIERLKIPSVTVMTQAGGRLALPLQQKVHQYMESVGGRFYVMYGQTEAAPRMSTLPHDRFLDKPGSVGPALQSGEFTILAEDGTAVAANEVGEVSYQGPNVMLGYARSANDLAEGDLQAGILKTGDMGFLDDDGFLTINGRSNRMGKVYGWRVNLDELEKAVEEYGGAAVLQKDSSIVIVSLPEQKTDIEELRNFLTKRFSLPASVYSFAEVSEIPKNSRNKTDYNALARMI